MHVVCNNLIPKNDLGLMPMIEGSYDFESSGLIRSCFAQAQF